MILLISSSCSKKAVTSNSRSYPVNLATLSDHCMQKKKKKKEEHAGHVGKIHAEPKGLNSRP